MGLRYATALRHSSVGSRKTDIQPAMAAVEQAKCKLPRVALLLVLWYCYSHSYSLSPPATWPSQGLPTLECHTLPQLMHLLVLLPHTLLLMTQVYLHPWGAIAMQLPLRTKHSAPLAQATHPVAAQVLLSNLSSLTRVLLAKFRCCVEILCRLFCKASCSSCLGWLRAGSCLLSSIYELLCIVIIVLATHQGCCHKQGCKGQQQEVPVGRYRWVARGLSARTCLQAAWTQAGCKY